MEKRWFFWLIAGVFAFFGFAYFVLPADFILDMIAFIGWLDDMLVNLLTVAALTTNILFGLGVLPIKKKEPEYNKDYSDYGHYEER